MQQRIMKIFVSVASDPSIAPLPVYYSAPPLRQPHTAPSQRGYAFPVLAPQPLLPPQPLLRPYDPRKPRPLSAPAPANIVHEPYEPYDPSADTEPSAEDELTRVLAAPDMASLLEQLAGVIGVQPTAPVAAQAVHANAEVDGVADHPGLDKAAELQLPDDINNMGDLAAQLDQLKDIMMLF